MNDAKYIGMDVHQATISVAVRKNHLKAVCVGHPLTEFLYNEQTGLLTVAGFAPSQGKHLNLPVLWRIPHNTCCIRNVPAHFHSGQ